MDKTILNTMTYPATLNKESTWNRPRLEGEVYFTFQADGEAHHRITNAKLTKVVGDETQNEFHLEGEDIKYLDGVVKYNTKDNNFLLKIKSIRKKFKLQTLNNVFEDIVEILRDKYGNSLIALFVIYPQSRAEDYWVPLHTVGNATAMYIEDWLESLDMPKDVSSISVRRGGTGKVECTIKKNFDKDGWATKSTKEYSITKEELKDKFDVELYKSWARGCEFSMTYSWDVKNNKLVTREDMYGGV